MIARMKNQILTRKSLEVFKGKLLKKRLNRYSQKTPIYIKLYFNCFRLSLISDYGLKNTVLAN